MASTPNRPEALSRNPSTHGERSATEAAASTRAGTAAAGAAAVLHATTACALPGAAAAEASVSAAHQPAHRYMGNGYSTAPYPLPASRATLRCTPASPPPSAWDTVVLVGNNAMELAGEAVQAGTDVLTSLFGASWLTGKPISTSAPPVASSSCTVAASSASSSSSSSSSCSSSTISSSSHGDSSLQERVKAITALARSMEAAAAQQQVKCQVKPNIFIPTKASPTGVSSTGASSTHTPPRSKPTTNTSSTKPLAGSLQLVTPTLGASGEVTKQLTSAAGGAGGEMMVYWEGKQVPASSVLHKIPRGKLMGQGMPIEAYVDMMSKGKAAQQSGGSSNGSNQSASTSAALMDSSSSLAALAAGLIPSALWSAWD